MGKSKVLVVGGTGFIGKRLVRACLAQGHETFILLRSQEIGLDIDKLQLLLSFKQAGAHLVDGSFSDHRSLVDAVKLVDVVISAMSGAHFRTHNILLQLKLVEAIKEAGNVKRFVPSEFGADNARMKHALEPGNITFEEKMEVRRAIEEAQIPHTYISANCFAAFCVGNLSQMTTVLPPKDNVYLYGDGNVKAVFVDEDDVATYTVKTLDDPRTLNKTIYLRPSENILSQRDLVEMYEKLSGNKLNKHSISAQDHLARLKDQSYAEQVGITHFYHFFYEGCLTNFEIGDDEEASKLYPEVEYTRMDDYLKRYI